MNDEQEIRALITRWAAAVHEGDLETTLADHASDIVMFDVPPPEDGIRGIDAYRKAWPPFFEFQKSGASFELVELQVSAGGSCAHATPFEYYSLWSAWRCIDAERSMHSATHRSRRGGPS